MASASLWLYRILLGLLVPLAVPVLTLGQWLAGKRRPPFAERLARSLPPMQKWGLWIQAVSVGEVEIARRLIAELRAREPALPLLLTATTATGLALARRTLAEQATVLPCPLDLTGPVRRVLDAASPRLVVLVETELWPELIHQAERRGVPVAVVNARLSDSSFQKYRRVRPLLRPLLAPIHRVLARDEADAERFRSLGVPAARVRVAGNIKYDLGRDERPLEWATAVRTMADGRPIVVAGSTMEGEETAVVDAAAALSADGVSPFLVLAPRHPERFDAVVAMLAERGLKVCRRSEGETISGADVFLIDTIGELARAYSLAEAAFIGGSLVPTGGHNPLEAAVWTVPVLSGRHVNNFREVYDEMTAAGGAVLVDDGDELAARLRVWLADPAAARAAGAAGHEVVVRNRGATERTVDVLLEMIGDP
ncbi:MAG: 3-deoxy-D-manno-octulosonic acid transferase [Holophagae bacterium]|jgi:3-deoxy-D-manno-octulosonic-acid transferase